MSQEEAMKGYNVLQAIPMSFYSKNLYRDVATNWGGKALLYLLFLLALSWIGATIQMQHSLNEGYRGNADKVITQLPVVTIKDGKLSTPENRPYIITDPDNHEPLAIIDTTGQYTTLQQAKTKVLVTQTSIITQTEPNEIKTSQIPTTVSGVVNPQKINSYVKSYLGYAWIILFVVFVILAYIYRIIQALVYSVIGKIFSALSGSGLTYGQVVQIAMVAITPVIVFATIFQFFDIKFPYQILFYFVLAMIYLFYGILANKKKI